MCTWIQLSWTVALDEDETEFNAKRIYILHTVVSRCVRVTFSDRHQAVTFHMLCMWDELQSTQRSADTVSSYTAQNQLNEAKTRQQLWVTACSVCSLYMLARSTAPTAAFCSEARIVFTIMCQKEWEKEPRTEWLSFSFHLRSFFRDSVFFLLWLFVLLYCIVCLFLKRRKNDKRIQICLDPPWNAFLFRFA